ncbi:unnamed protein product, partial [Prorocentrum cordatum]
ALRRALPVGDPLVWAPLRHGRASAMGNCVGLWREGCHGGIGKGVAGLLHAPASPSGSSDSPGAEAGAPRFRGLDDLGAGAAQLEAQARRLRSTIDRRRKLAGAGSDGEQPIVLHYERILADVERQLKDMRGQLQDMRAEGHAEPAGAHVGAEALPPMVADV